ncbi:MAG: sulfotransferase [Cyanobacteriota bacterium]|nr:sulfotransferase [Cyanobacteriota bacterium]
MKLPNFLIIGAAKSGTTSLYHYLKQHPSIYMSPIKEPDFFSTKRANVGAKTLEEYSALFEAAKHETALGEASVIYLTDPTSPDLIFNCIPDVKMICMLRNPIEASYSGYLAHLRIGRESKEFSEALKEGRYLNVGFYYRHLSRYFAKFNSEQIKIYFYDDFIKDNQTIFEDLFNFIGVDNSFVPDTLVRHNSSPSIPKNKWINKVLLQQNILKNFAKVLVPSQISGRLKNTMIKANLESRSDMSPEIKSLLLQKYKEDILNLQDLVNKDLTHWLTN